jgi:hypothetical protein
MAGAPRLKRWGAKVKASEVDYARRLERERLEEQRDEGDGIEELKAKAKATTEAGEAAPIYRANTRRLSFVGVRRGSVVSAPGSNIGTIEEDEDDDFLAMGSGLFFPPQIRSFVQWHQHGSEGVTAYALYNEPFVKRRRGAPRPPGEDFQEEEVGVGTAGAKSCQGCIRSYSPSRSKTKYCYLCTVASNVECSACQTKFHTADTPQQDSMCGACRNLQVTSEEGLRTNSHAALPPPAIYMRGNRGEREDAKEVAEEQGQEKQEPEPGQ